MKQDVEKTVEKRGVERGYVPMSEVESTGLDSFGTDFCTMAASPKKRKNNECLVFLREGKGIL